MTTPEKARKTRKRLPLLILFVILVLLTAITGQSLRTSAAASGGDYSVTFFILLYINLFLVLGLGVLVVRNTVRLWLERRKGLAGSQLRTRLALLFVVMALLPALVITFLSAGLLNRGVDSWFSDRITKSLEQSLALARSYYQEHQRTLRHDAEDIARNKELLSAITLGGGEAASRALELQRRYRDLDEVSIIRADGTYLSREGELPFDPLPDFTPLAERQATSLLVTSDTGNRARAFVRIDNDLYLSTGRWIDREVLAQMESIESTYVDYNQLRGARGVLKTTHTVTLVLITLLLLLAAVWSGFRLADEITSPITDLVVGTRQVAAGDFSVTMPVTGEDEIATLLASFNAMTHKLAAQRDQLQASNALLEERRRFMEAIVNSISAGVLKVDRMEVVTVMNAAAGAHLGLLPQEMVGRKFQEGLPPEVVTTVRHARQKTGPRCGEGSTCQIHLQGPDKPRTLLARVTDLEDNLGQGQGFLVTFDDVSEVLAAQRAHAWSDVARRIAHEIKNPLTPIQLSAQRMRRKYLRPAEAAGAPPDWRILDECTDTIVKQVEELRVLVNEFSNFARLPRPDLEDDDLNAAVREILVLHEEECRKLQVRTDLAERIPRFPFDRAQIKQVLTNLVANALAAIREREGGEKGRLAVATSLRDNGQWIAIEVADNGAGIPVADREKIFEPYFTTKRKGTGLGLAIVKKIVEDHQGTIRIRESEWQGALVEVLLPVRQVGLRGGL